MQNFGYTQSPPPGADERKGHSIFSLVVLIVVVGLIGVAVLGVAIWALGFLFGIVGLVLKVAVLAAVAGFVWKRVTRDRGSSRWS